MPPLKSINSYIPIVPTIIPTTVPIVTKNTPSPDIAKNRKKKIELNDKIDPSKEEFQKLYQEVGSKNFRRNFADFYKKLILRQGKE
jgi:hypothetical protein